jgi:hypothetical protein
VKLKQGIRNEKNNLRKPKHPHSNQNDCREKWRLDAGVDRIVDFARGGEMSGGFIRYYCPFGSTHYAENPCSCMHCLSQKHADKIAKRVSELEKNLEELKTEKEWKK